MRKSPEAPMSQTHYRTTKEVSELLGISPSTLRSWTQRFAEFLSPEAANPPPKKRRRYTDEDIALLMEVKGLRQQGFGYNYILWRLRTLQGKKEGEKALVEAQDKGAPVVAALADVLHSVATGQSVLLNSQQVTRELLGTILQDNFNLKEENTRLRDRMLQLERDLFELRRESEARRAALEERIHKLEEELAQRRPGCLGFLLR